MPNNVIKQKKRIPVEVGGNKGTDNRTDNTTLSWSLASVAL